MRVDSAAAVAEQGRSLLFHERPGELSGNVAGDLLDRAWAAPVVFGPREHCGPHELGEVVLVEESGSATVSGSRAIDWCEAVVARIVEVAQDARRGFDMAV